MTDEKDIDRQLKEAELERIKSEIERNNAERDRLKRSPWRSGTTYAVAGISGLVFVLTFSGFLANLYTMLTVELVKRQEKINEISIKLEKGQEKINNLSIKRDRLIVDNNSIAMIQQDLRTQLSSALASNVTKEQKLAEIRSKLSEVHTPKDVNDSIGYIRRLVGNVETDLEPAMLSQQDFDRAVLVLTWDAAPRTLDAFVIMLCDPKRSFSYTYSAQGLYLGNRRKLIDGDSREWVGRWEYSDGHLTLEETYPYQRTRSGLVVKIDLSRDAPNGGWVATRTIDGREETGVAEFLFPPFSVTR